jgi:hypothetical protein
MLTDLRAVFGFFSHLHILTFLATLVLVPLHHGPPTCITRIAKADSLL